jgi:hypothetical protein
MLTRQTLTVPSSPLEIANSDGCGVRQSSLGRRSLVAGACNHPNWLTLPFRFELIRKAGGCATLFPEGHNLVRRTLSAVNRAEADNTTPHFAQGERK